MHLKLVLAEEFPTSYVAAPQFPYVAGVVSVRHPRIVPHGCNTAGQRIAAVTDHVSNEHAINENALSHVVVHVTRPEASRPTP